MKSILRMGLLITKEDCTDINTAQISRSLLSNLEAMQTITALVIELDIISLRNIEV